jgi:hypothetical protein
MWKTGQQIIFELVVHIQSYSSASSVSGTSGTR